MVMKVTSVATMTTIVTKLRERRFVTVTGNSRLVFHKIETVVASHRLSKASEGYLRD